MPVGPWILEDVDLISDLAHWRAANSHMFFSQFPESTESMRQYLIDNTISDHRYVLFLIENDSGDPLGHLGLKLIGADTAEVDSVMKSPSCRTPGLMDRCLKTLVTIAGQDLKIDELRLEVVSSNSRAIGLYVVNGFREVARSPLFRTESEGHINHIKVLPENSNVDFFSLTMMRKTDRESS